MGRVQRPLDLAVQLVVEVVLRDADRHVLELSWQASGVVGNRPCAGSRVAGVLAGDHAEHQRGVADRAGQRAGMVQRPAQRHHPVPADAPIRRLQAHDTAESRRDADGAPGVAAHGRVAHARGDADGRAAAGASRGTSRVPRILRRAVLRVDAAVGELRHVGLAHDDRARLLEPRDDGGVLLRNTLGHQAGRGGGADPPGVVEVFQRDRDAVKRAQRAVGGQAPVRLARGVEGLVAKHRDEGVERGVGFVDAFERGLGQLQAGDLPAPHHPGRLGDGEEGQRAVSHHSAQGSGR